MIDNVKPGVADKETIDHTNDSVVKKIKLLIVEEQEILQEAYKAAFPAEPTIELTGISSDAKLEVIIAMLAAMQPDVVLLGTKMLQPSTIRQLEVIREQYPNIGIILLSTLYDIQGIKELR
ncbi:MAG: hypothetical protein PHV74_03200 [Dehalococcoidia bacterium]|nr:hypothetical protein [Dehalococcoidia bacterium]